MDTNELVSVIVPAYNSETHIKRCLDSIVNSTYENIEVVVVNDGSDDGTEMILNEYEGNDDRIKIINQNNMGVSGARNTALDNIMGDYVLFVDSDDFIEKTAIEKLIKHIRESDADVVVFPDISEKNFYKYLNCDFFNLIYTDNVIGGQLWRFFFKSELFENIEFPLNRFAEDAMVIHKVLYKRKIFAVDDVHYHYFASNLENISNSRKNQYKNSIDRTIMYVDKYTWGVEKGLSADMLDEVLRKAVRGCLTSGRLCKYENSNEDFKTINSFVKSNIRRIIRNKKIPFSHKSASLLLAAMPGLYYKIVR